MILICRTYEIVTEESAELGDVAEAGFIVKDEAVDFHELVRLMEQHSAPSCSRPDGDTRIWLSWPDAEQDYRTGEYRMESLHYSPSNPPRNAKYWRMAMRAARVMA